MNILLLVFIFVIGTTNAFGHGGHRIIGRMVWIMMNKHTRNQLIKLYGTKQIFIKFSSWPDLIKADMAWRWTFKYHFINAEDDPPVYCGLYGADTTGDNLLTGIEHFRNQPQSVESLSFLIHLLGDLHQPLHITAKDHGGTRKMVDFMGRKVSLHLLWDTALLRHLAKGMGEEAFALSLLREHTIKNIEIDDIAASVREWAHQTSMLNCQIVFNPNAGFDKQTAEVKRQLFLAANRITRILEIMLSE